MPADARDDAPRMSPPSGPAPQVDIVPGTATIVIVLGVLLLLTAATVAVALLDLSPAAHVGAAMAIAAVKSVLVAYYFMHLSHESRLVRVMVIGAIFLLSTLIGFVLLDVFNRD